jgi:hypothetical protein
VRIRGYFSKPKGAREQKSLGNTAIRQCWSIPLKYTIAAFYIPGVRARNQKNHTTKSVHYTDVRFAPIQTKTLQSLFWLLPTLVDFNVGTPGGMTTFKLLLSVEVTFHVSGIVKRHNCRIWGNENPHVTCGDSQCWSERKVRLNARYGDRTVTRAWSWTCRNCMCFAVTTWNCLLTSRGMASLQPYREESPPSHDVRWRSATAWPPRSPDLTPLDFCCGVTGRTKCSSAKQPSQVVESPHKGRCSYGNPQNVLQNTRTEVEYRLDICLATTGDTQKSTKVRTQVKSYVCKGANRSSVSR